MHSHNRTALSKFGFQDGDRRNRRHDQACQYVAAKRHLIMDRYVETKPKKVFIEYERWLTAKSYKGPARNAGRIDVFLTARFENSALSDVVTCVEVKISEVTIGDILAQMKFYKSLSTDEYAHSTSKKNYLVVVDFPVSDWDHDMLGNAGIDCMRLGPDFEEFIKTIDGDHRVDLL